MEDVEDESSVQGRPVHCSEAMNSSHRDPRNRMVKGVLIEDVEDESSSLQGRPVHCSVAIMNCIGGRGKCVVWTTLMCSIDYTV